MAKPFAPVVRGPEYPLTRMPSQGRRVIGSLKRIRINHDAKLLALGHAATEVVDAIAYDTQVAAARRVGFLALLRVNMYCCAGRSTLPCRISQRLHLVAQAANESCDKLFVIGPDM